MSRLRRLSLKAATGGAPVFPLVILFGLNAVDELDRTAFSVLVPNIRDHFHLSLQGIMTVVALVSLAVLLLEIPIAYYSDRGNRVLIAAFGALAWAMFSLMTGLSTTIVLLAIARAGSGIGKSVVTPTHFSLLADYYDVSVRAKVYAVHRAGNALGMFVGPALAGVLAHFYGWRSPFVVFTIPTLIFVALALRLREPTRGAHERRAAGASQEVVETAEQPPSFSEAWRMLFQIKTLRWIWYSLPFLVGAIFGLAALLSVYYEKRFGLDEVQRGFFFAFVELGQLPGLALGAPIANRLLVRDPGLALKLLGAIGLAAASLLVGLAFAPNFAVAVAINVALSFLGALLVPAIYASLSLAIPPRARSLGFSVGSLFAIPGLWVLAIVGRIADSAGIRAGLLSMVPVYLLGAFILASAGRFVAADIRRVRMSTVAQAEVLAARRRGEVKLLLVKGLDAGYGSVQILFGVDFEIDQGEIVALLGTNGAGKSTLLRAISGLIEAQGGAVIFDGRDMTFTPPQEVAARGVVQVPGGRGVFPSLTVAENLKAAGWLFQRDRAYLKQATEEVLSFFPVLRDRWNQRAGTLSGGEQQMLTLAQAFIAKPRLLMIDELSLGLSPVVVGQLLGIIRAIRSRGTTIILVEQSVNLALSLAETAYFMEKGEIRFHGKTGELLKRPDILRSVFLKGAASVTGGGLANEVDRSDGDSDRRTVRIRSREPRARRAAPPILEVEGAAKSFGGVKAVDGVSLQLRPGEILGVIGPNGAGKTTLFNLISGFILLDEGRIVLDGVDVTEATPDARARLGLGRSFQDARLFPSMTVAEAIAVALESQIEVRDPIAALLGTRALAESEAAVWKKVDELIELMGIGAFRDKFVSELSTGSRRIVDLACVLAHRPKALLFDEPSSGIAQRETEALGPLLERIAVQTGAGLLVIEHDVPLLTSIADEILALDLGRQLMQGLPDEVVSDSRVVAAYLGTDESVVARSGAASVSRHRVSATSGAAKRGAGGPKGGQV